MPSFTGAVSGIDVREVPGYQVRCFAFISRSRSASDYVQVATSEHRFQTLLESASARGVNVLVEYEEDGDDKLLTRVQIEDRNIQT